jgi:hypothetical protein
MRVRIWNAYASNNSGSYTIVGALPSEEVARSVADELTAMIGAHAAWLDAWDAKADPASSPLAAFCRAEGLSWSPGHGGWGDWPDDNKPRVTAVGHQVIVHHPYTVSLPPTFGELFYKRGGRVQHEEDHAHDPIVAIATFWWGWSKEDRARMEIERPRLVAALTAAEGALARVAPKSWPAAWQAGGERFDEAPLTVGAIFADLIDGVSALGEAARQHHARMLLRVYEAPAGAHDPLAHLRLVRNDG